MIEYICQRDTKGPLAHITTQYETAVVYDAELFLLVPLAVASQQLLKLSSLATYIELRFSADRCPSIYGVDASELKVDKVAVTQRCSRQACEYVPQSKLYMATGSVKWWYVLLQGSGFMPSQGRGCDIHGIRVSSLRTTCVAVCVTLNASNIT